MSSHTLSHQNRLPLMAWKSWLPEEEDRLIREMATMSISEMAKAHDRTEGAIECRIIKILRRRNSKIPNIKHEIEKALTTLEQEHNIDHEDIVDEGRRQALVKIIRDLEYARLSKKIAECSVQDVPHANKASPNKASTSMASTSKASSSKASQSSSQSSTSFT